MEEREGRRESAGEAGEAAERRDPDVFIAPPASFLHPSLHSLPGELREVGRSDQRERRGRKPRARASSRWGAQEPLEGLGVVWEHSSVSGSPSYTSVAQGQGRKRVLGGVGGQRMPRWFFSFVAGDSCLC